MQCYSFTPFYPSASDTIFQFGILFLSLALYYQNFLEIDRNDRELEGNVGGNNGRNPKWLRIGFGLLMFWTLYQIFLCSCIVPSLADYSCQGISVIWASVQGIGCVLALYQGENEMKYRWIYLFMVGNLVSIVLILEDWLVFLAHVLAFVFGGIGLACFLPNPKLSANEFIALPNHDDGSDDLDE